MSASASDVTRAMLGERLLGAYAALLGHFGSEPHWWPIITDAPQFEIVVGTVLVQQTRWETVEAAIARLQAAGLLRPAALAAANTEALAAMIRPCAFHMQKAPGLQAIARYLCTQYDEDVAALLARPRAELRAELLALPRIGRETADTIMLYGGTHPLFIVDAYARRLLARLGILTGVDATRAPYDTIQAAVEAALSGPALDARLVQAAFAPPILADAAPRCQFYRNFHALIVEECIHHCLATRMRHDQPGARRTFVDARKCAAHCRACTGCPLRGMCATYHADSRAALSVLAKPPRHRRTKI
ncbi:MAG TPA: DNA repair protein [Kouleothrix sp.]|nr:DNA repair protein [Kouleothrix sp.]